MAFKYTVNDDSKRKNKVIVNSYSVLHLTASGILDDRISGC